MNRISNNKKILLTLFIIIGLFILIFLKNNSAYAIENETYTREEIQDMIESTAVSYWKNGAYSDYGQTSMDNFGITGNYYNNPTLYWRDLNVSPEQAGRSNYFHIDCSGYAFLTYFNTLGYDMSKYSNINSYMLFYQGNTYKMRRVNDHPDPLAYHRAAYKRFGQAWNNAFMVKVANKISNICSTSTCASSNDTGIVYNNLDNSKQTELAYYYIANGKESLSKINSAYAKVKNSLQPGDVILYRKINSDGNETGHVMLYVENAPGYEESPSLLHSTGSDYNVNATSSSIPVNNAADSDVNAAYTFFVVPPVYVVPSLFVVG